MCLGHGQEDHMENMDDMATHIHKSRKLDGEQAVAIYSMRAMRGLVTCYPSNEEDGQLVQFYDFMSRVTDDPFCEQVITTEVYSAFRDRFSEMVAVDDILTYNEPSHNRFFFWFNGYEHEIGIPYSRNIANGFNATILAHIFDKAGVYAGEDKHQQQFYLAMHMLLTYASPAQDAFGVTLGAIGKIGKEKAVMFIKKLNEGIVMGVEGMKDLMVEYYSNYEKMDYSEKEAINDRVLEHTPYDQDTMLRWFGRLKDKVKNLGKGDE